MELYHLAFHSLPVMTYAMFHETDTLDFRHKLDKRHIELGYMLKGSGTVQAEGGKILPVTQDCVIVEVHDRYHSFRCQEYHSEYCVHFTVDYSLLEEGGLILPRVLPLKTPDNSIRQKFADLAAQYATVLRSSMADAMLLQLLGDISVTAQHQAKEQVYSQEWYVQRIKKYVAANLVSGLQLSDIAEHLNITPAYLSRLFHKAEGFTLITYINRLRMQKVEDLILHQNLSLKEAGNLVGLNDPNYVSRLFRRVKGYSITQLRHRYLEQTSGTNINKSSEIPDNT